MFDFDYTCRPSHLQHPPVMNTHVLLQPLAVRLNFFKVVMWDVVDQKLSVSHYILRVIDQRSQPHNEEQGLHVS